MRPDSTTGLYWSIRGEVACTEHAPDTDDSRWVTQRWAPVPMSASLPQGSRYQCQHCSVDGRAVVHQHQSETKDAAPG